MRTLSYAGGTNDNGMLIPAGGFDTYLTLYGNMGGFLAFDDDGRGVIDPSTGLAADAELMLTLLPGRYFLAPTQLGNQPLGDLADGFLHSGRGCKFDCVNGHRRDQTKDTRWQLT